MYAPVDGVELTCSPLVWNADEVFKNLSIATETNTFALSNGLIVHNCFPKDVKALSYTLREYGCNSDLIDSVDVINERQKLYIIPKVKSLLGNLKDKTIAVWGLSFKPKTDDMREAPSIPIIKELISLGAKIKAFDPVAEEEAKKLFPNISYGPNPYDVLQDTDCLIIITEWDEFRYLDKQKMKSIMKDPNVIDGRNIYDPKEMKDLGFNYCSIGRV